ncbi:MAG: sulfotransferase [Actinobacteria bacterium]|nr:sulfotransferase [Actinomycetota bacterium]
MGTPAAPAWQSSPVARVRNNLDLPRAFLTSAYAGLRDRQIFADVQSYCMFIGYPRSGHSLLGSLLDAHPDAAIAHEADILRYVQARFGRLQVYSLALESSRRYRDKREIVYDYTVPGQWQGRYRRLRVLGDKKGGRSTRRLAGSPGLLDRLQATVGVPTRFIHVARNPFDNITTILQRSGPDGSLAAAVAEYLQLCATVAHLRVRLGPEQVLDVRHEALLGAPHLKLLEVCTFLGLEAEPAYLDDCAAILYAAPRRTRHHVPWPPEIMQEVNQAIDRFEFLHGYTFDDDQPEGPDPGD